MDISKICCLLEIGLDGRMSVTRIGYIIGLKVNRSCYFLQVSNEFQVSLQNNCVDL